MSGAAPSYCFIAPPLDGPVSGGTLYNRELCAALVERSAQVSVCSPGDPRLASFVASADHCLVDTLYLAAVPALAQPIGERRTPLTLLTHYLPTLVRAGRAVSRAELSELEARALGAVDSFLVTSAFMGEALAPLVAPKTSAIFVVEPGSRARLAELPTRASSAVCALLVANLLPGKGVASLLEGLARTLRHDDAFQLQIIGRLDADPAYAAHCAQLIRDSATLRTRVTLRGSASPEETRAALADAQLFVSASIMESYGMALAEARVTGIPIVACAGGNAAAHVDSAAGGELVTSPDQLSLACLALARDRSALAARRALARRHAPLARPWSSCAEELHRQLVRREK